MGSLKRVPEVDEVVERIRKKMKPWGITLSYLAEQLGVSRQYAWQIVHYRTMLSMEKAREIERTVDRIIEQQAHMRTFGDRLRAARISAGLTLKQVASMIGYTWVGVERWEKNMCVPKPGVLWHLCNLYCVGEDWFTENFPAGRPRPGTFRAEHRMGVRGELAAMYLAHPAGASRPRPGAPGAPGFMNPMIFPDVQRRRAKTRR
jgi:transcriptional regulator with XRE-family HTH domain